MWMPLKGYSSMNMTMYMPVRLVTGRNCVAERAAEIAALGPRCLIITGRHSSKANGSLADVTDALDGQGVEWGLFDEIGANPLLEDCERAGRMAREMGAAFVIGIGGGSAMDAAKCAAVFAANPGLSEDDLYAVRWQTKALPQVMVGTTAGTGSEVTMVAVITDRSGRKRSFRDPSVFPVLALGDARYTMSMSERETLSTAADAGMHCVESYFNRQANDYSRTVALRGLRILKSCADMIREKGTESLTLEDREALYAASIYGGMAIAVTGTAMPHAVSYLLTEEYHISHGTACAVFPPDFFALNEAAEPELCKTFLEELRLSRKDFLAMFRTLTPEISVSMTEKDAAAAMGRFENNNGLKKTFGSPDALWVKEMLMRLFSSESL